VPVLHKLNDNTITAVTTPLNNPSFNQSLTKLCKTLQYLEHIHRWKWCLKMRKNYKWNPLCWWRHKPAYYITAIVACHALLFYSIMYFTDSSRVCA